VGKDGVNLGPHTDGWRPASEPFVRVSRVRPPRLIASAFSAIALSLLLAPSALAADGVGSAGRVGDKTITLFMFAVIAFFPILVITLAFIQGKLEARKERRRYDLERLG
jgi:hypothetical protein